jgi:hypothetical protein
VQEELLKQVQERLCASLQMMGPEAMLKTRLPTSLKSFDDPQNLFFSIHVDQERKKVRQILNSLTLSAIP